jgi:hypothetical protein
MERKTSCSAARRSDPRALFTKTDERGKRLRPDRRPRHSSRACRAEPAIPVRRWEGGRGRPPRRARLLVLIRLGCTPRPVGRELSASDSGCCSSSYSSPRRRSTRRTANWSAWCCSRSCWRTHLRGRDTLAVVVADLVADDLVAGRCCVVEGDSGVRRRRRDDAASIVRDDVAADDVGA